MLIYSGDVVIGNGKIYLYWGRCGGVYQCRSLLETMLKRMTLYISSGDGVVVYGTVYLYWRRCGRLTHCRSLLGTVKKSMVL